MTNNRKRAPGLSLFALGLILIGTNAQALAKAPLARIGANTVKLEVAATDEEVQRGLMFRTAMPEDAGMVFIFNPNRPVNFWMYHTLIPLDMLFIKEGKIVKIFDHVPPCKSESPRECPQYPNGPGIDVSEVVEVNAGYAQRHNVKEGDAVSFELPQ